MENVSEYASHVSEGRERTISSSSQAVNVGDLERVISTACGTILAAFGLSRSSPGGLAMTAIGGMLLHRGVSGYCPVYSAVSNGAEVAETESTIQIREVMTIRRPRHQLYEAWRNFEQLPRFLHHIESIEHLDSDRTEWRARFPTGIGTVTWQSEITADLPNERIAWQSLPEADIENEGEVIFQDAPGERGTEVKAIIEYRPPAGYLGRVAAGLANPIFAKMIREDIRRFKSLMETGEIPTVANQPAGP